MDNFTIKYYIGNNIYAKKKSLNEKIILNVKDAGEAVKKFRLLMPMEIFITAVEERKL